MKIIKPLFGHNLYKDICSTLQKCENVRVRRIHLGNFTKGNEVPLPETVSSNKVNTGTNTKKIYFRSQFRLKHALNASRL